MVLIISPTATTTTYLFKSPYDLSYYGLSCGVLERRRPPNNIAWFCFGRNIRPWTKKKKIKANKQ